MHIRKSHLFASLALVAVAPLSQAQNDSRYTFHAGGGFTEPVKWSDGRLDTGFNLIVGGGVNLNRHFALEGEFGFNHLGVNSTILQSVGVPSGQARVYSLTLNPTIRLHPRGRVDGYLTVGGGFYRRTVEFTTPTTDVVTAFDPFWGTFYPAAIPSNLIVGSYTQNKGGFNVGGGVDFRVKQDSNAKFFVETRLHYMYTTPYRTTILPVSFGFRW